MHKCVLNLFYLVWISVMSETSESGTVKVDSKRLVWSNEYVNTHIELLTSDKQRVHNIPLNNIWLSLGTIRFPSEIIFPLCNLLKFVQKKNTSSLWFTDRFHNPNASSFLEFFNKDRVVAWQVICSREKVISEQKLKQLQYNRWFLTVRLNHWKILTHWHHQISLLSRAVSCVFSSSLPWDPFWSTHNSYGNDWLSG